MAWSPVSAVKFGTPLYHAYPQDMSRIDTKWFVLQEGAALLNWRPGKKMPDHAWYHQGEAMRSLPQNVFVGGAGGGGAVGYVAFAAGPEKIFIDRVGLGDPLLGRLPALQPPTMEEWKSGHFHRPIPDGYVESVQSGKNLLRDANIRQYYDYVRIITQRLVFSPGRFTVILAMNLGKYEYLRQTEAQSLAATVR